jgi:uncharacterized protein (TIGR00251 family)
MIRSGSSTMGWIKAVPQGFLLRIRVVPNSAKSFAKLEVKNELKVYIHSPPVDGAANEQLIKWLSATLGVSRSTLSVVVGPRSRRKIILCEVKLNEREIISRIMSDDK